MSRKQIPVLVLSFAVLCLGIFFGPVAVDTVMAAFAPAPAIASTLEQEDPPLPAEAGAQATFECDLRRVMARDNYEIFIECWQGNSGVFYYGIPANSGIGSNNVLAVALTAKALGRTVIVEYEATTSGNFTGCSASCRRLLGLWMN